MQNNKGCNKEEQVRNAHCYGQYAYNKLFASYHFHKRSLYKLLQKLCTLASKYETHGG